jgi:predicted DNA-binding protein (UPF0251 family)
MDEIPDLLCTYLSAEELADLARRSIDAEGDTHAEAADLLGVARTTVTKALTDPVPRTRLLRRVISAYPLAVSVADDERYAVVRDRTDVLDDCPYDDDDRADAWKEGVATALAAVSHSIPQDDGTSS